MLPIVSKSSYLNVSSRESITSILNSLNKVIGTIPKVYSIERDSNGSDTVYYYTPFINKCLNSLTTDCLNNFSSVEKLHWLTYLEYMQDKELNDGVSSLTGEHLLIMDTLNDILINKYTQEPVAQSCI